MTRSQGTLYAMAAFIVAIVAVVIVLLPTLMLGFRANPALNGVIGLVLVAGTLHCIRQVQILKPEIDWLQQYQATGVPPGDDRQLVLLAPMVRLLVARRGQMTLSPAASRSILDGIIARLDENRELSRYLVGLLIFLGLLGTFWGLLQTVETVGGVINNLSVQGTDLGAMFTEMQKGLSAPLGGMSKAFSSSLFGLAGSLVLGFLEMLAARAQDRFCNELEDWLSATARPAPAAGVSEGEASVPAYLQALLEQTAENIDALQRTVAQSEDGRRAANNNMAALIDRLSTLTDQMRTEQQLMIRLAESNLELRPLLARVGNALDSLSGLDDISRQHIRNIDAHLSRLIEDGATGRVQAVQEVRSEIKLLARTIAALADEPR
ncbi:MAG: flagellar motor protein MotA [Azospirillaceae bacterium]|nr:flagellar motor protein MotA [Azospirillaceae bacterium]